MTTIVGITGMVLFIGVPALLICWILYCVCLEYRTDRIPIILYHRLISKEAALKGEVPDEEMVWASYDMSFAKQMKYLHEKQYTPLDFDDYLKIRSGEAALPRKPIIITFDDGYLSTYTMAYPIMKKYAHKATIFVALEPDEHTRRQVDGIDDFLSSQQMRDMARNGISFQSHTLTHCILTELEDERVLYELTESSHRLSEITDLSVQHVAIPRAGYNRRIKRLVKKAGYRTACCNNKGSSNGLSDAFALPRIVIERDMTVRDFARCLTPRSSAVLRILGTIKRIPEFIGGARFARRIRDILYAEALRPVLQTRSLKWLMVVGAIFYGLGCILFVWNLMTS